MNDSPPAPSESPARAPSLWRNWISLAGGIVAAGALFAFLFLFVLDLTGRSASNPYLGILCYVVAPGFLILGMAIAGAGAWLENRHRRRGVPSREHHLSIDLARPRDRRILVWFSFGTMTFLLMTAVGSYQTFVYTESNQFCGEVCHAVMGPEYTAYHRSPHAKIACVECHVGSGATWYVKAKINGTHQLIGVLTGKYSRPIETPVKNMRPASDTCAQCHWPQRYVGSLERTYHRYLADDKNTPYTVRMLVNVGGGGGGSGPAGGIHWHMNVANQVEYYASDPKRQAIPWVRVTGSDGAVTVYRTADFKGEPPVGQIRRMDCIDCHNRPAHRYQSPNDAVDEAIYLGHVDPSLKSIKRIAVDLLTKNYPTQDAARTAISDELHHRFPAAGRIGPTIAAIQTIYTENIFPEMKADWSKYPDNIGHLDSAGCFRCHDGKHLAVGDNHRMPATDCNTCHTILAQGAGADLAKVVPEGQPFRHPSSDIDGLGLLCNDCHNGKNQEN